MRPWPLRRSAARSRESSPRLASGSARASGTAGEHGSPAPWGAPISPPRRLRVSPPPPRPAAASARRGSPRPWSVPCTAQELTDPRRRRGDPPVTTLWPWGATGEPAPPERRATHGAPLAFGSEAYLRGLWQLLGSECRGLPGRFEDVASAASAAGAVLIVDVGAELERDAGCTLA